MISDNQNIILDTISAPKPSLTTDKEKKELLIANYLPNLSNYQKINKQLIDRHEKVKPFTLCPDVNYSADGKNYFIFYNNNLTTLKDIYKFKLDELIKNNSWAMDYDSKSLKSTFESDNYIEETDLGFNPLRWGAKILSYAYQDIVNQGKIIAKNLSLINYIIKNYGKLISPYNICAVTVTEDLFEKISVTYYPVKDKKNSICGHNYLDVENELEQLSNSEKDEIKFIDELDKKIDKYKKIINPLGAPDYIRINDYCFVLNRASQFLNNYERSFADKSYELIQKMDKLRRKIDNDLLAFRFKYMNNESSILDIRIDRYKILIDTSSIISIYLEKEETKKFINNLEYSIERKASNLKKGKNYEILTMQEIKEIAGAIRINSYEDLINELDRKIEDFNLKLKSKNNEAYASMIKLGYNVVVGIGSSVMTGGAGRVGLFQNISNQFINKKNEKTINISSTDVENYLLADKTIIEKYKESSKEKKTKDDKTKKDEINQLLEERKKNAESFGIDSDVTNENLDELNKCLQSYKEMESIQRNIILHKNQKRAIESRNDYTNDFINSLKLYSQFKRNNYYNNDNYSGVIIEEKKRMVQNTEFKDGKKVVGFKEQVDLREYIIYKIMSDREEY